MVDENCGISKQTKGRRRVKGKEPENEMKEKKRYIVNIMTKEMRPLLLLVALSLSSHHRDDQMKDVADRPGRTMPCLGLTVVGRATGYGSTAHA